MTKNREKNREQLFLAQNCLNRIMSQLLDNTIKITKNRGKNRKIIFGSEFSETNNQPTFRLHQKIDKNREKIIFGPANNEPTFRLHQKNDKKSRKNSKNIIGSELSTVMMQLGCISRHCTTSVLTSSTNPSIPTRGYTRLGGARPFCCSERTQKLS